MRKSYTAILCIMMLILTVGFMLQVSGDMYVRAEATESTTEMKTEEMTSETTQEAADESTEQSTEEEITEETTEELDNVPPEVLLICLDKDEKAQDEICCQITVTEEHLAHAVIYVECLTLEGEKESWTIEDVTIENKIPNDFSFCEEGAYQVYAYAKDQTGNETVTEKLSFLIDRTPPAIELDTGNLKEGGSYATNKKQYKIGIDIQDPYLLKSACEITLRKEGEDYEFCEQWIEKEKGIYADIVLDERLPDGGYELVMQAQDFVGNCNRKTIKFTIDNTTPEIEMNSDKNLKKWTRDDVVFQTEVRDAESGLQEVVYKVKGKVVKKVTFEEKVYCYRQEIVALEEADKSTGYAVVIEVKNQAGLKKTMKQQVYIDKTEPELTLEGIENGTHYNKAQLLTTQVCDVSYEETKTRYYVTRMLDGKETRMIWEPFSSDQYEDSCTKEVLEEGYYTIYAVATDAVGNKTRSHTLSFVIDCTAPVVNLRGVESEIVEANAVVLQLCCEESFYATNEVNVNIRRTLDSKTTIEQIDGFSTEKYTEIEKIFEKDGTYVVTISAIDKAGNVAIPQSVVFTVDRTKPKLQITGTENYKLWNGPITLQFKMIESFYEHTQVAITGTRKDMNGTVQSLKLPAITKNGKSSSVEQAFREDGIYNLQFTARDEAGNENAQKICFVIDQTEPQIRGVKQYDGGYFRVFRLTDNIQDIFKDLTVISYQMYLNGVEYNGTDTITQEGKYVLQICAQDEVRHEAMQTIEFVVDHTPPKVNFFGVLDGETVYQKGELTFCLINQEDKVTRVSMNGKEYDVDTRSLSYEDVGSYQIEVDSKDRAGNETTQQFRFIYANTQREEPNDFVIVFTMFVLLCIVPVVGICIRLKRREKQE